MADKSFGVKELNLLGSSGTPSIDSPNDLNLNANTVAISTNLTVGSKLSVTSAGILTAVSGVVTYFGDGSFLSGIEGGVGANGSVNTTGVITASSFSGIWSGSVIKEEFGGTNQSTYTKGDILYASNTNTLSKLAVGSDTDVLTLTSGVPSWEPAGTSGVPGIDTTGTSTFEDIVVDGNAGIGSINVSGVSTFTGNIFIGTGATVGFGTSAFFPDNAAIYFGGPSTGAGDGPLQIYHSGLDGIIKATDDLWIKGTDNIFLADAGNNDEKWLRTSANKGVCLFYNGDEKFATSGIGVTIYDQLDTTNIKVSGVATFHSDVGFATDITWGGSDYTSNTPLTFEQKYNIGVSTFLFKSAGNNQPEFTFQNSKNGNWGTNFNTGTQHLKFIWEAPNEAGISTVDNGYLANRKIAALQEITTGTSGASPKFRFWVNDNTTGMVKVWDAKHNEHVWYIADATTLKLDSTRLDVRTQLNVTGVSTFEEDVSFEKDVNIGGTLTYEDVTNVDSVGLVTAGKGVRITTGGLVVTAGVSTFSGDITANGNVGIGTTNAPCKLTIATDDTVNPILATRYNADTGGATIFLQHSRSDTIGTKVALNDNDVVGDIEFRSYASDNSTIVRAARIFAEADGTADGTDVPAALVFSTNDKSGAGTAQERLRITSAGDVGIGTDNPTGVDAVGTGNTAVLAVGVVTATSFYGDGTHLTGTGGGTLISGITVKEEGTNVGTGGSIKVLNFCGSTITATESGDDTAIITVSGFAEDAQYNLYSGTGAGAASDTDTCYNIGIGYSAAHNLNSGDKNVFIGKDSGRCFDGSYNIFLGNNAGQGSATITDNDGTDNIAIGRNAGKGITCGCENVFIGKDVAGIGTYSRRNVVIGWEAASAAEFAGGYSTIIGPAAGKCLLGGSNNVFIGRSAGHCVTTGQRNTYIGDFAGGFNTADAKTGSDNTSVGNMSGYKLSGAADRNTFLGPYAGCNVTTGSCNVVIGNKALVETSTGRTQLAIGIGATNWIRGDDNFNLYDKNGNAIIGGGASGPDAQENFYVGTGAGAASDTDTCYNIGIGYSAAYNLNSGDNNLIFGKEAGYSLTSGQYNVFLGCHTGYNSNGTCNFFAVNGAGCFNETGINNVFIGNAAGRGTGSSTKDASSNIAMGSLAGMCLDSGDHNIFFGELSGVCSTNGDHNIFLGNCAGRGNRTGDHNVVMGYRSFSYSHTGTGSYNVLFGKDTACKLTSGDDNVFLGRCSAINITTGNGNVAIGYSPGAELDSGHHNILIGNQAGKNLVSGDYNIAIGRGVEFSSATGDCQLVIGQCLGNWIVGDSSLNIGIGTEIPSNAVTSANTKKLSVGILSAYQLYGDGQYLDNVFATSGNQGGATVDNGVIVGTGLSISGISTLSNVVIGDESAGWNTGGDDLVIGNGEIHSHTGMTLYSNANDNGSIWFSDSVTTDVVGLIQYRHNEEAMRFSVAGTEQLRIDSAGNVNVTGMLTATSFSGDGTALTGLGGDTLISGITVKEEGTNVGTGGSITTINFVGDTVTATASGDHGVDVTIESSSPWLTNDTGIHTTARVGIGTTTATPAMLNLHGSGNNDLMVLSAAGAASTERITIGSTTLDNGTISFEGSEGTLFSITNNLSSGSIFSVNDISGIPSIDVDADGTIQLAPLASANGAKVGIGTTNPSTALHVVGDVKVTGVVTATDFDSTSDIRLKTNIKLIDDPLAKIIQIEGVSFNWKQDNRPALGVIADQIEKVIPELVHGDDPKTVNYNGLVGLLIEVVKDQQTQIDNLNKRLSKLE